MKSEVNVSNSKSQREYGIPVRQSYAARMVANGAGFYSRVGAECLQYLWINLLLVACGRIATGSRLIRRINHC